ncbi:MAG TPA: tetratricopeptide repeat protein [Stellaceae bacterium]|nr:tetratricopeptide repeat protein [Stellaceae bacterium]
MHAHKRFSVVLAAAILGASLLPARAEPPWPHASEATLANRLAAAERRFGPRNPQLLPILASLAHQRFEAADLAAAMALRRRAMKIAIATYGNLSVPAAQTMAALADLYVQLRRYLDAEPLALTAANVLSARLGAGAPALAPLLADRARIALARGDLGDARIWAERAVAIDVKTVGVPRSDRLRVLGAVLTAQHHFAEAERLLRRAVALDRAGTDPLATARSLARLGQALLRQKRFAEALAPIEEATAIDQDRLGATHPLIAEDFHDLGLIYLATGRVAAGASAFRTAIDGLQRGAAWDTPTLAYIELDLARAEHMLGHEDRSQSLFRAARHILNAVEDDQHERERAS